MENICIMNKAIRTQMVCGVVAGNELWVILRILTKGHVIDWKHRKLLIRQNNALWNLTVQLINYPSGSFIHLTEILYGFCGLLLVLTMNVPSLSVFRIAFATLLSRSYSSTFSAYSVTSDASRWSINSIMVSMQFSYSENSIMSLQ